MTVPIDQRPTRETNPKRVTETDNRTHANLLDAIANQGREAAAALNRLRSLISNTCPHLAHPAPTESKSTISTPRL